METYIFKIIACSLVLIGFYYLFLAKEKSFRFNRFYLIFALLFSYIIPLITLKLPAKEEVKTDLVFQNLPSEAIVLSGKPVEADVNWALIIFSFYGLITFFLLAKSIFSIVKILRLKGDFIKVNNLKTKILEESISPFSFLGTLYIGKNYFKNNSIDERIFLHEKNHIEQRHSLDLILIEVLKIFSWFNPVLYFYKKAIITNHEFLADENVLAKNFEIKAYQKLILDEISSNQNLQFTNPFNYSNTKKRFIMMTKTKSRFTQLKQIFALPVLVALSFVFVQKTYAADAISSSLDFTLNEAKDVPQNLNSSADSIEEFLRITDKYSEIIKDQDFEKFKNEVPRFEQEKLVKLYQEIDVKDYKRLPIFIYYNEINKQIPTQKQIEKFLNKKYKVNLNNEEIDNSVLRDYKNTDFYSVYILKVQPKNPDFGKYEYGVVLYTNEYAKKFNQQKNIAVSFKVDPEEYTVNFLKENKLKSDTIRKPKTIESEKVEITNPLTVTTNTLIAPPKSIYEEIDVLPEFPGGLNSFRNQIATLFNEAVLKGDEGTIKTEVYFVIDKDGKVSNVEAFGTNVIFDNEAVRSTKSATANQTWKPAMKDGKPVRYRYRIPLTMQFDSPSVKQP